MDLKADARGRIDDDQPAEESSPAPASPASGSGSSISEEDEAHVPENHVPPAEDLERLDLSAGEDDELSSEGEDEYEYEEEEEEWDPEDEDWDLLQGGEPFSSSPRSMKVY
jgi:hypothetical protein